MSIDGVPAVSYSEPENVQGENTQTIKFIGKVPKSNLPSGWIGLCHQSGGIIYLHKSTRVVTWSRPYQLSKSTSARKHDIPLIAIPCLHQKVALYSQSKKKSSEELHENETVLMNTQDEQNLNKELTENEILLVHSQNEQISNKELYKNEIMQLQHNQISNDKFPDNKKPWTQYQQKSNGELSDTQKLPQLKRKLDIDFNEKASKLSCSDVDKSNLPNDFKSDKSKSDNLSSKTSVSYQDNALVQCKSQSFNDSLTCDLENIINSPDIYSCNGKTLNKDTSLQVKMSTESCKINNSQSSQSPLSNGAHSAFSFINGAKSMEKHKNLTDLHPEFVELALTLPKNDSCSIILENASNSTIVESKLFHDYLGRIFTFEELKKEYQRGLPLFTDKEFDEKFILNSENQRKKKLYPVQKNPLQKLYEYCQQHFKTALTFSKLDEGLSDSFCVEVVVGSLHYGVGRGDNKKNAKHSAAQVTLEIMDPKSYPQEGQEKYFEIFDNLSVDDPTVFVKTKSLLSSYSLAYPYKMMINILARQYGMLNFCASEIDTRVCPTDTGSYTCSITFRDLKASITHSDRRVAKNLSSQYIIKQLYSSLTCWGSVIRLHKATQLALQQTALKDEKQKILKRETKSERIINILKEEMRKIGK